jgi:hypothetical protein
MIVGLRGQARTGDPSLPKRVRSQLRYAESLLVGAVRFERMTSRRTAGLQPAAMSLSATHPCKQRIGCPLLCLRYLVETTGIEPATPCLQGRCSPN